MTLFIGPAICEPEKHGIIADIPISTIARHNLNQVDEEIYKRKIKKFDYLDCNYSSNFSNVK
jgi:hypothetical protein